MADNVKTTAGDTAQAVDTGVSTTAPLVIDKKKKKKKYSRGLRNPQKLEQSFSRAGERLAKAVADGVGEYRKRSSRSARKKRDGAIRDAVRNVGRGFEAVLSTAAKAPTDLTRRLSTRRLGRLVIPPPFSALVR